MNKASSSTIFFNGVTLFSQENKKGLLSLFSNLMDSCTNYLDGKEARKLEKSLVNYLGKGYVSTTSSGHDALLLSLLSLDLQKNDEIIFPVNSYPTAFAVAQSGAKMVPCEADENGQLDPMSLEVKINERTKVVIVVHLYGLVGKIYEIKKIIKNKKIYLIEDCAQAFGSLYKEEPVGTLGDISCFSFYPTKNLFTFGDGGAIWTKHKKLYQHVIQSKQYGERSRYKSEFISGHSRIPEIQSAIVNYFFKQRNIEAQKKRKLENYYRKKISSMSLDKYIRPLASSVESNPLLHLFVIYAKKRNGLSKFLKKKNILTLIHYPKPVHLVKAFSSLKLEEGKFPIAEDLSEHILSLPFHSFLTYADVDRVLYEISSYYLKDKVNDNLSSES